jgi:tetratricopeptide (TPR) repeat protein
VSEGAHLFPIAVEHHQKGDSREAERLYRAVIQRDPRHDEALNLLGVLTVQTGKPEEAADLIGRAIQINGTKPEFHYNMGLAQLALNDRNAAIECFRRAVALRPDYAEALINLGNLFLNKGENEEAEECFRSAVKLVPGNPVIHNNLGTVLIAREEAEEAEQSFREALTLKPNYPEALNGLGLALGWQGKFDEAIDSFQAALRHKPNYAQAYNNLGNVYFDEDRLEDAEDCYLKAMEFRTNYAQARRKLARTYLEQDNSEAALGIYEGTLADDPESKPGWSGKANVLDRMRRTEEAYEIVRRFSQDGTPPLGMIQLYTVMAGKEGRSAEVAEELETMMAESDWGEKRRRMFHFVLGDLYDRNGAFDDAFKHYEEGNRLRPTPFDPENNAKFFDNIMEFYSAERLRILPRADNDAELPVFIVGSPRSGTSLVEQILSCHKDVYSAGECRDIGKLSVPVTAALTPNEDGIIESPDAAKDASNDAAERHLQQLRELSGNARRVTDKMPYNFLHLGLISLLFPRARVIHCVRDPIDTCLSCYFQNFARGNFQAFDLRDAGLYYRQYQRLMAHWGEVLDLPILEVRYEEHVAEPERVCREMLDFLGLDWDPACLRFHESSRFTKTASRDQVREPIYTSSAGRWRNYERHIGPLIEALGLEA